MRFPPPHPPSTSTSYHRTSCLARSTSLLRTPARPPRHHPRRHHRTRPAARPAPAPLQTLGPSARGSQSQFGDGQTLQREMANTNIPLVPLQLPALHPVRARVSILVGRVSTRRGPSTVVTPPRHNHPWRGRSFISDKRPTRASLVSSLTHRTEVLIISSLRLVS